MIRVLHIFGIMNMGGAETMMMNVYRHIDRTKIQFDFLCMNEEKGDYEDEIKELGGRIYKIPAPSKVGYVEHIKGIINICKMYGPYQAIHIPTMFHSGIVCLAAFIAKIPIRIVHAHTTSEEEKTIKRKIYNFVCRRLINIFSTVKIACGEAARDFLFGKTNRVKKQVIILKNGINIGNFSHIDEKKKIEIRNQLEIEKNQFIIGHVGRFVKVKNHEFFIKLAKSLDKENYKILLVGDGELKGDIENKIKEKHLENKFILTCKRKDINVIMSIMDIFVMPSLYEGFPMVLIEALASGKNCVVSDNISKEVDIDEGSIDFANLNDDIQIWIDKIIKQTRKKVDMKSRIKILEDNGFSIENTTDILTKIYLGEENSEK